MWDSENKRIAFCGEGRGRWSLAERIRIRTIRAVTWDMGSDLGQFSGHSRGVNSVDFRPCRPFRLVSSSDDMLVSFYQGPPFCFDHSDSHHKNFVHAVRLGREGCVTRRYSPDGAFFVSVSGDKTVNVFEGKVWVGTVSDAQTGQYLRTLNAENGHTKGVYGVGWDTDCQHVYTASADCTIKVGGEADSFPVVLGRQHGRL